MRKAKQDKKKEKGRPDVPGRSRETTKKSDHQKRFDQLLDDALLGTRKTK